MIRRLVGQARFPESILRGAQNTLTTNGLTGSRRLIVAISRGADGARAGVVSRAGIHHD